MTESNLDCNMDTISMEDHQDAIQRYSKEINRLREELEVAKQNELVLWRTFGPAMLQQIQQQQAE